MDLFLSIVITILFSILILGLVAILVFFIIEKVMKHSIKKCELHNDNPVSGDDRPSNEPQDDKSEE